MKINEISILKFIIFSVLGIMTIKLGYEATIFVSDNFESLRCEKRQNEFRKELKEKREKEEKILAKMLEQININCRKVLERSNAPLGIFDSVCDCMIECVQIPDEASLENDLNIASQITREKQKTCFYKCYDSRPRSIWVY